ncbi:MAG: hypothetical protein M3P85_02080, partial [Actinomycetota bacterium]|nr:hypothetical protein [Actinomycetota bacterium]
MSGRRRAAIGLAAVVAAVVLVLAVKPNGPDPAGGAHPAAAFVTPAADPVGQVAPSEEGARAAAVAVATSSQDWLYLGDADMAAAVRAVATPAAAAGLAAETVGDLGRARDALAASPGRVWWVVRP